ncbi:MAG: LysM peptidoglycan-binding domain-containing protein [Chloroflexota bacterium]
MQHQHSRLLLLAVAGLMIISVVGGLSAHFATAQGTNLLQNGGFEGTYAPFQGDSSRLLAPGWSAWNVAQKSTDPSFFNATPEYRTAANPRRIRSGSAAQEFFTFFGTHTGGVFQRVGTTAGTTLQFSVWVNVWSTSLDDINLSEQPGRVRIRAGIDPLGGTDGTSPNIVWKEAPELYDQYQQVTVDATAGSSFVTVFVESQPKDPVKNNNVYVDDASLVATGTVSVTTAPTAVSVLPTNTTAPLPTTAGLPTNTPAPIPTREGTIVATVAPSDTPPGFSPTDTPTSQPPSSGTETPMPTFTPTVSGGTSTVTYTVVPGDSLSAIATRFNSTPELIAAANGLNASGLIFVGQTLIIPVLAPPTAAPTATPTPFSLQVTSTPVPGVVIVPTLPAPVDSAALTGPTVNGIGTYIVQSGDDLPHIAARYGLSVEALSQLNGIVNARQVVIGTVLVVPGPGNNYPGGTIAPTIIPTGIAGNVAGTHVVQPGENLFRISLRYNVTLDALMRANGISNPNLVFVGQVLRIP